MDYDSKKRKRPSSIGPALSAAGPAPITGKGLRTFSLKVCEKVEAKRVTTYNEVADELVAEFCSADQHGSAAAVDQKNIRRRVYDALNVLMAMDIISKDKKAISWRGLPGGFSAAAASAVPAAPSPAFAADIDGLLSEKSARVERIMRKRADLAELMHQQLSYRALRDRNAARSPASSAASNPVRVGSSPPSAQALSTTAVSASAVTGLPPTDGSAASVSDAGGGCISVPFIIVNCAHTAVIECEVADDRTAYFFNLSEPFSLLDDTEMLGRMGLVPRDGVVEHAIQQLLGSGS